METKLWKKFCFEKLEPRGKVPSGRVGHSCICVHRNEEDIIVMVAGATGEGTLDDVYILNLQSMSWSVLEAEGLRGRYEHVLFSGDSGQIFVFGGADTSSSLSDLQCLNLDSAQWSTLKTTGSLPSPRTQHHSAVLKNGSLVVFGGGDTFSEPVQDSLVHVFNTADKSWSLLKPEGKVPCPRQGHCLVVVNGLVYLHGGMANSEYFSEFYVLNPDLESWKLIDHQEAAPSPRAAHGAIAVSNCIYVFGGFNGKEVLNDLYRFDTESESWTVVETEGCAPSPRLDFAMCAFSLTDDENKDSKRDVLFIHGGTNLQGMFFDDAYIFPLS